MANRFGLFYGDGKTYDTYQAPSAAPSKLSMNSSNNQTEKKRKAQLALQKKRDKRYIETGSGHDSILNHVVPKSLTKNVEEQSVNWGIGQRSLSQEDLDETPVAQRKKSSRPNNVTPVSTKKVSFATSNVSEHVTSPDSKGGKEDTGNETKKSEWVGKELMCNACGNMESMCHQVLFGSYLTQECIMMVEDSVEPEAVTEADICRHFTAKYNDHLKSYCWDEFRLLDTHWYMLPMCLEGGAMMYTLDLINKKQIYDLLAKQRVYGVARDKFFNTADKNTKKKGGKDKDDA